MGSYIDWADVIERYPELAKTADGSDEMETRYIGYAENYVNGLLASNFTVPFSSNNETAKDLSIEAVYLRARRIKGSDWKDVKDQFMDRIAALKSGQELMLTTSGTALSSDVAAGAWSSTGSYHPVYGIGDPLDFAVDSSQVIDENEARGNFY